MRHVLITIKNFKARFPKAVDYLTSHGIEVIVRDSIASLTAEERVSLLYPAEALFIAAEPCDAAFLQRMPRLKILSRMGSGMDNVDLDYCRKHGIAVTNSRGCNANAVAEMTLLLMLASLRGLCRMHAAAESGSWNQRFAGEELYGKTVGLVGFGLIAQRLASLLSPFCVTLLACDPCMNRQTAEALHVTPVTFDELIARSDVVSVHVPALQENLGLFNKKVFTAMKDGAVFINCSRGALVIEDDLLEALQSRKLYAGASDVWCKEPLQANHPLFSQPNFIGTPHIAGMSTKSAVEDSMTIARSIVSHFEGNTIEHRIV